MAAAFFDKHPPWIYNWFQGRRGVTANRGEKSG